MSDFFRGVTDLRRLLRATGFSLAGLEAALRHEAAFRQEIILFVILAPLGVWLGQSGIERALLVGSLFIVLIVELLNSAIETTVDRIGRKRNKLSGRAKDMGSAAVLLSIILAIVVWALILFGPGRA
ncbi:MAG: diacylglycerol kinase [Gammaproteobacteria bacterium]|nr:MAG: diacylglycerol kinase [Gammaproteobacteria bacterium]